MVCAALLLAACDASSVPPSPVENQTLTQAGKPTALHISNVSVVEGQTANLSVYKTGGNGKPISAVWRVGGASGSIILNGSTPVTIAVPTVDDNIINGTRTITVTISAMVSGSALSASATITELDNDVAAPPPPVVTPPPPPTTQTCPDGSVIPVTSACPPPVVVTPPPPPTPSWVPSPSLTGVAPIPSEFDPATAVQPSGPASSGAPDLGAFRFICAAGQLRRDDPIVYPGQPGKSHLHQFYGNLSTDAYSTYASLRASGKSSCGDSRSNNAVNRSGYWMPALLDGLGDVIQPDQVAIYYKRWPATDPHCNSQGGYPTAFNVEGQACVALPFGLRFIFGANMMNLAQSPTGAVQFMCTENLANYETMTQALDRCRSITGPTHFIVRIEAPNCWDGKNLDSPDHRSHVAYSSYGGDATGMGGWGYLRCPTTHPYVIPTFTMNVQYTIAAGDNTRLWHYSSDEMVPGTAPGTTFHSDWFGAWDPVVQAMWTNNCINLDLSCQSGNLGNGYGMAGADWSRYFDASGNMISSNLNPNRLVRIADIP
jgi:hypothetical protein